MRRTLMHFVLTIGLGTGSALHGVESVRVDTSTGSPRLLVDGRPVRARMFFGLPGTKPMPVSERAARVSFEFWPSEDELRSATMHFPFGQVAGTIVLDDLRVEDLTTGQEVLAHGDFETGESSFTDRWHIFPTGDRNTVGEVGVQPGCGRDGSAGLHVAPRAPASGTWPDVHLYHRPNLALHKDHRYRVSFWVQAQLARRASANPILIRAPALPSVLVPAAVGLSVGSESSTRGFHDGLRKPHGFVVSLSVAVDQVRRQPAVVIIPHKDDHFAGLPCLLVLLSQRHLGLHRKLALEAFVAIGVDALLLDVEEHDRAFVLVQSVGHPHMLQVLAEGVVQVIPLAVIPWCFCHSCALHRKPYKYNTAAHPLGSESGGSFNSFPYLQAISRKKRAWKNASRMGRVASSQR